jgi:23S rRNA pseudouridine1911/1915/1917 synthase
MVSMEILFEDEVMLVLDKPAGWVTTKESTKYSVLSTKYVEDWVEEHYPNSLPRKGIVHRLDKGTSGVLVVAKNQESLDFLKKQFKQRKVVKHYWAMAGGDLPKTGNIKMPIGRSNYQFKKFKVKEDGKVAETEFKVIKKYNIEGKKYSLVDINLKTGRTHQIRVHFSYMGWPLLGDAVYGGQKSEYLTRPFLHSYFIQLTHPVTNKMMTVQSEMAVDLKKIVETYG